MKKSSRGASFLALSAAVLLERFPVTYSFAYVDQPDGGFPKTSIVNKNLYNNINADLVLPKKPLPNPDILTKYADFASQLADAARSEILPYWRQSRHALGQQIKVESDRSVFQSASPVTLADRAAERAMRDLIEKHFPDHGIYGEEYGVVRQDADFVWVLDPIDGTRSFITGKPLFGTLISCLYRGYPVIGIIDQCVLDERWIGVSGRGSTLNGHPIQTDGVAELSDAEMYSTTPDMFKSGDEFTKFDKMRKSVRTPHYGADCYAYALVASGFGADIVVEADLGLYDYCAIVPVLEGAGGVITDWTGMNLSLENHERSKGRVLASANKLLHDQALEILNAPVLPIDGNGMTSMIDFSDPSNDIPSPAWTESRSNYGPLLFGMVMGEVIAHFGP